MAKLNKSKDIEVKNNTEVETPVVDIETMDELDTPIKPVEGEIETPANIDEPKVEVETPVDDVKVDTPNMDVEVDTKADVNLNNKPNGNVKIRMRVDHKCCIAMERYDLKAGKTYVVPVNVKNILNKAGFLAPL